MLTHLQDRNAVLVINEIRTLAGEMADGEGDALLASEPHLLGYRSIMSRLYREAISENEKAQAREILAANSNGPIGFSSVANPLLHQVYARSGAMTEHLCLNDCQRIILVGCGWIPATLFHFQDNSTIRELVGIDLVPEAVETARAIARFFGYDRTRFELSDGRYYDFCGAQIVYIVGVVSEKADVLSRIASTAPEVVQVVVNEPYSLGHLWHETVEPYIDPRFEIAVKGPGKGTLRNLLLRRRAQGTS
jgi:hypothetical protein